MTASSAQQHVIRWKVTPDGGATWMPRQASMRGSWGFDAECSCGWRSRTGGALERRVRELVAAHKADPDDE